MNSVQGQQLREVEPDDLRVTEVTIVMAGATRIKEAIQGLVTHPIRKKKDH